MHSGEVDHHIVHRPGRGSVEVPSTLGHGPSFATEDAKEDLTYERGRLEVASRLPAQELAPRETLQLGLHAREELVPRLEVAAARGSQQVCDFSMHAEREAKSSPRTRS